VSGYTGRQGNHARRDRRRNTEAAPATTPAAPQAPGSAPVSTIATLGRHEGQSVTLRGWLYNLRESGKLLFPIFRDGTGTIQGVAHVKSVPPAVFEALKA